MDIPTDPAGLAGHWRRNLGPLDGPRWPLRCARFFSATELDGFRRGLWPRDMDDRWAIWLDGDTLRCWRSWTNTCIYELELLHAEDGTATGRVLHVLDDPARYQRSAHDQGELDRFDGVLALLLRDTRAA